MAGRARARRAEAEMHRTLALMAAYFGGQLSQADWQKMPSFAAFLAELTQEKRPLSNDEIAARFEAMAQAGLAVERVK